MSQHLNTPSTPTRPGRRGLKTLAVALTVALASGWAVTPAHAQSFTDVPPNLPFASDIEWVAAEGISTGWPDGTYRPFQPVTREAMAAFLYRMAGSPQFEAPDVSPFSDVQPGAPFYAEITWLQMSGITTGWKVGDRYEFRPQQTVNRDAMAAFLYRFDGSDPFEEPDVSPFVDINGHTQFYAEMSWLKMAGISTGWDIGDGRAEYRPLEPVKRDAMAAFLHRLDGSDR